MDDATAGLAERVGRLERSARRWRWAAMGLGGVLVGGVVAGAGKAKPVVQDLVVAKELRIVGDDGNWHIVATTIKNQPWFRMEGSEGNTILSLAQNKAGGSLMTSNLAGDTTAFLGSWDKVGGRVYVKDLEGATVDEMPPSNP